MSSPAGAGVCWVWIENGRRWRCNFCNLANEVASDYLCTLKDGERTDAQRRPELRQGLCEFVAPSEYMVRAPQPPCSPRRANRPSTT